jgi:DNA-binding NtrC family response regulator
MPTLRVTAPDGTSSTASWKEGSVGIGREPSNHVVLDHEKIARWHAAIFEAPGPSYRLRDLGSPSGVWLGEERVRSRVLQDGDEFTLGPYRLTFTPHERKTRNAGGHVLRLRFGRETDDPLGNNPETRELPHEFDWSGAGDLAEVSPRRLFEAVRAVAGRLDLDEMLACLLDQVETLLAPSVSFAALAADDGSLDIRARRVRLREQLTAEEIRVSQSIVRRARESGQPVLAHHTETRSMHELSIVRAACLPVVAEGRVRGIVYADWRTGAGPEGDRRRIEWITALVLYAGSALENALHYHGLRTRHERLQQSRRTYTQLVGVSDDVRRLLEEIDRCAARDVDVLVVGPTGTGKELVARRIHERSKRCDGPFVAVNCASIPRDLFESEMFGHVRGAFTGASANRLGRMREAHGGTLFLDEFAELPLDHQARLLRVLEDRAVSPVGGTSEAVDVRIIAASNRDLVQAMRERTLREDLYHRLGFMIRTTPLHSRRQDLPLLAYYLLDAQTQAQGEPYREIAPKVMDSFFLYGWPGNVRQLGRTLRNALVMARDVIQPVDIQPDWEHLWDEELASLEEVESDHIRRVLHATGGNQGKAAKILGVAPNTLKAKMDRYGIERDGFQA